MLNDGVNFVDPSGLKSQACYGQLENTFFILAPSGAKKSNLVVGHQQILFDDGTNIGYGDTGILHDIDTRNYTYCEDIDGSKEDIMKISNELFLNEFTSNNYKFYNHNCQDFVDRVREELNK